MEGIFSSIVLGFCAVFCIITFCFAKYQVKHCKVPIEAMYLYYNRYYGGKGQHSYAPVFRYTYQGKEYESQTYESYSFRKLNKLFTSGQRVNIWINEKNPKRCVTKRRVSAVYYLIFLIGIICLIASISVIFS